MNNAQASNDLGKNPNVSPKKQSKMLRSRAAQLEKVSDAKQMHTARKEIIEGITTLGNTVPDALKPHLETMATNRNAQSSLVAYHASNKESNDFFSKNLNTLPSESSRELRLNLETKAQNSWKIQQALINEAKEKAPNNPSAMSWVTSISNQIANLIPASYSRL